MNKIKYICILSAFVLLFSLTGCKKNETKEFDSFLNAITDSANKFTSYEEKDEIKSGEDVLYYKNISFEIERGEIIKTRYEKKEKQFNQASEQISSYYTVGDKKYQSNFESSYEVPNYWLNFAFNKDFLKDGYSFSKDGSKAELKADILDDKVSSFFVLEELKISNLSIMIVVMDDKLTSFEATFLSKNGFSEHMSIQYGYEEVTIES